MQRADLAMARNVTLNAKMRRTGICGATETILVDRACVATHLKPVVDDLLEAGCEVRGDAATRRVRPARAAPLKTRIGARNSWTRSSPCA